jgi:hypothetical protein
MLMTDAPVSLNSLSERELGELLRLLEAEEATAPLWTPQPGPQTMAYNSEADEVYYGGSAGGGKSDLLLGLAFTRHQRSLIFRREYPQLKALIDRSREIVGPSGLGRFNANDNVWRMGDGRVVEFGAVQHVDDWMKYQGRPNDLLGLDELPHFALVQYRSLIGWNRTTKAGQRCRVVGAGNPPLDSEQRWVIDEWAPWLDDTFPEPAHPGELRWYVMDGDKLRWLRDGGPVTVGGKVIHPRSRTFIPASVKDNPTLLATGYENTLLSLPEPLRSILMGNFRAGIVGDPWQVIPAEWVKAAMARWKADGRKEAALGAVGVDVAFGGADRTVIAPRFGLWFAPLIVYPGAQTPNGSLAANYIYQVVRGENLLAPVNIDALSSGADCYSACCRMKLRAYAINFGAGTDATDRTGVFVFRNVRAFAYWSMRELLDPANGYGVALPPDKELLQELAAPKFTATGGVIQIEKKEEIKKRLQRSPDKADAVVNAVLMPQGFGGDGEVIPVRS